MQDLSQLLRYAVFAFVFSALFLVVGGCSRNAAVPAASANAANAADSTYVTSVKGEGFAYRIAYPPLPAAWRTLDDAMRAFGATAARQLVSNAAKRKPDAPVATLDLSFDIARRTTDLVSVLTNGEQFTGGAHGMPIIASFTLDLAHHRLVTLDDLFADPTAALQALSKECRRQLEGRFAAKLRDDLVGSPQTRIDAAMQAMREWVAKGTTPTSDNFKVFLVDGLDAPAIGLTLIFPPYQVAAYADGVQQVEVPSDVFYALLKPEYRNAFAVDTQTMQPNGH